MSDYLRKIAKICMTRNVQLLLFATPEHPKYTKRIPQCYTDYSNNLAEELVNNGNNIRYVNYTNIYLPDSLYGDGDHLNYLGNIAFSNQLLKDSIFH